MQTNSTVIICGAGPTGLMLAAQLLRFNTSFIIIDMKSAPTTESRAVVVQARSMEIYEQMGLADEIVADAAKTDGICFWRKGKKISKVELKNFGSDITPFDFLLMYEQSKNETLLYHFLQKHEHEVEWNTELISYKEEKDGYRIVVKKGDSEHEVTAQYIIACDGAKSKVRELAAMEFTGGTYEHVFYVADTHIKAPVCSNKLNFFVANDTFNILFPMTGDKRFRAIGILPKQYYHHSEINFAEVSAQVDKDAHLELGFYDTQWYATYRLHHKKVRSFSKSNIYFCGDAAHVHSPAGGQGMNTGLQDAYNLSWKLALVVQQKARQSLLDTYHEERNPVAENLLKTTDRLFSVMANNNAMNILLRMYIMPAVIPSLMKITWLRRALFLMISQTKINYTYSSLARGRAGKIKAGMRFPYIKLSVNSGIISVYDFIRFNATLPFLLFYYNIQPGGIATPGCIKTIIIEKNNHNDDAFQQAGFSSSFICLVRPDNYIGYISSSLNVAELSEYLYSFLINI